MSVNNSFQKIITSLQSFWIDQGCVLLQPYDLEVGAGTFHPATVLRVLGPDPIWKAAYVQPCRRPTDGRYGENPNRLQHYYQFQVIIQPSPEDIQNLYLESLKFIGLNPKDHDIRFVEDDWESPTLGASGLGWEIWCDGMEISQFTYFQQVGGIEVKPVASEITYGLERLAMFIQKEINKSELLYYIISQLIASLAATFVVQNFDINSFEVIANTSNRASFMLAEILFTFLLVFVILNVALHPKLKNNQFYGFAIGLTVAAGALTVGDISGAVFNPAVSFGPSFFAIVDPNELSSAVQSNDFFIYYLIATLIGSLIASYLFKRVN